MLKYNFSHCHGLSRFYPNQFISNNNKIMFNPHPRMEGDDMSCQGQTDVSLFQSTPSHGGRLMDLQGKHTRINVSIHALTWRATGSALSAVPISISFNPRPHMEGDILPFSSKRHVFRFNPRPHMEGDDESTFIERTRSVSIHALTWRATYLFTFKNHSPIVSIHALTWRATLQRAVTMITLKFQSTPSHGGRH